MWIGVILLVLHLVVHEITLVASVIVPDAQVATLSFFQNELAGCREAQQSLSGFLHSNKISIGMKPGSIRSRLYQRSRANAIISTEENKIECRVALGRAPLGVKCVAPCACTGSQKWIQFSELNKLRRKDPEQWTVCRTCQQKFDYAAYDAYGGVGAAIVGYVLEHRALSRSVLLVSLAGALQFLQAPLWLLRLLTSRALWMKFPQWSRLAHVPLPLKFWGLRALAQFCWGRYLQWEREGPLEWLAALETRLIEERLPAASTLADSDPPGRGDGDVVAGGADS